MKKLKFIKNLFIIKTVLILVIALTASGCKPAGKRKNDKKIIPVMASFVTNSPIEHRVEINGEIKGQNQVDIYPDVPGKVLNLYVREGQFVGRGQIVATIDRSQVGMIYRPATVTSPISGVIGKIYVEQGMTIANSTPLMLIADTRIVEGVLNVTEKQLGYFKIGQKTEIKVESYPDIKFRGYVSKISSMLDPSSRTLEIRVRLFNIGNRLLPGNYADFSVIVKKFRNQVIVPIDSIIDSIERTEVFVVEEIKKKKDPLKKKIKKSTKNDKDKKKTKKKLQKKLKDKSGKIYVARLRRVKTGLYRGKIVQILAGLKPGERVVTLGKENIIDGSLIKIISQEPEKKNKNTGSNL
ncbi:MAG: efflux RND transporter periplasmic adaptor subunit [Spirochaetes bacterium]|nr:efflux RND transporter periplasmic adaptor subunit [Spirochaetota bacterium]